MYQPELETLNDTEKHTLQSERLRALVKNVYERVETYTSKFDEAGISPSDIESIEDIATLPFTVKDDMRKAYPYGMFAVPLDDIVRVHSSSGTTGQISVVGYTQNDIDIWSECVARAFYAAHINHQDIIQVSYGYGLFTGGLGAHYGAEKIGATAIPVSGGNTSRQVQILKDFKITALACTPSYALRVGEVARDMGIDVASLPVKSGIFGAEPWSEAMRDSLQEMFGIKAYDIYGLSEVCGPGVGFECDYQDGLHINEDYFYPEIIDTETLEPVAEGEYGELVFTTLLKQGIPLIRYRTRDITRIIPGTCKCGRTLRRIERITGRSDDMLIIRGVNVYPSQIEDILLQVEGVAPHYQLILTREGVLDSVEVQVELATDAIFDEVRAVQAITRRIKSEISSTLGISVAVKLIPAKSLTRSEGKIARVIDLRNAKENS